MTKPRCTLLVIFAGIFLLTSCENKDLDNTNRAQVCIDKVSSDNYQDASECLDYLDGISGKDAALLRCSISLFAGGITPVRVTNSIISRSNNSNQGEAYLITALAMDNDDKADDTAAYCRKSGSASLEYISNLAVIGTQLAIIGGFAGSITTGGSDYSPSAGEISAALTGCGTSDSCQEAIGGALVPIAEDYCAGGGADQAACDSITEAVDSAGGSNERIGELFICLMQNPPVQPASCP